MIYEKIHKPSSSTRCVQILPRRVYEFFRVVLGSLDKERKRANGDSSNSFGKDWVFCVIDGITRFDAFFFVLFHNKHYNKKDN